MAKLIKAVQFRNIDEARKTLADALEGKEAPDILSDGESEPQGLLTVIPEDRLEESDFHRLFDQQKGVLVEVERISYSGFGPPAEEPDYMGFESEGVAYILKGARLPIEIEGCSFGARDFHELDAMVLDGSHPIDRNQVARSLELPVDWGFDTLFDLLTAGKLTAQELDALIHRGIQ